MRLNRLDLVVSSLAAVLLLATAIVIWRGDYVGVSILSMSPAAGNLASASAPLVIEFAQRMNAAGVEANFEIQPDTAGRFIWRDNTLFFLPQSAWARQVSYTVILRAGVEDQLGHRSAEDLSWTFSVREAGLVFLRDTGSGYDLWAAQDLADEPAQLTHAAAVFDFAVSVDGEHLVFSVINEEDGIDLWVIDRNGENERLFLDCGPDRCSAPDWSVDDRIAFTRVTAPLTPADPYGAPRIWLLDPKTGESLRLHSDAQKIGYGPSWSPDGQRLAYFDGIQNRIVVLDLRNAEEIYLPSSVGVVGSWTPNGNQMIYYDTQLLAGVPANVIFRADFETQDILPFFDPQPTDGSYSNPIVSPDGNWVAMKVRPIDSGPGDEIWVTPLDGRYALAVTDEADFLLSYAAWDPRSAGLVFSRIQLGVGNPVPEVWVWNMETAERRLFATNADAPAWLP